MSARPSMMRGYELIARTEAFDDDDFSETAEQFPPYIGAQVYLKLIANLAKRENIPLLLTISPYACNDVERGIFSWLKEFAAEREINILNYNGADGVRVGIDRSSDLSDIGHTNYGGAVKVTRDVGAFLEKNYTLRSRVKVADAAQRDADAEQFDQKAKISTDITTVDPAAFFSRAAADSSYTVLVAGKPNETQMAAFLPMGFVSAKAGECFAGLSSGGKPITESSGEGARISQALGNYDVIGKPDSSEIVVNGTSYLAPGGIAVLLFKNDFGWPLDFAVFTDGVLEHSEFTSSDLEALLSHRGAVEEKE
ncbi:MAG: hypothetical protein RR244_03075 [Oscillospiraceae bacterium]